MGRWAGIHEALPTRGHCVCSKLSSGIAGGKLEGGSRIASQLEDYGTDATLAVSRRAGSMLERVEAVHPEVARALRARSGMERLRLAHETW